MRGRTPTEWSSSGPRAKRASNGCASSSAWRTTTPSSSSASRTIRSSAARRVFSRVFDRCDWRPSRTRSLRALAGQLVTWQHAKEIERDVIRRTSPVTPAACTSRLRVRASAAWGRPICASSASTPAARPLSSGCAARSTSSGCTTLPTYSVVKRLAREPGLGPWSAGVVCLQGLGRSEHGLVGDLGLIKICSPRNGRRVETAETAALLEPYGEWAGLASVYMLAGLGRGLIAHSTAA